MSRDKSHKALAAQFKKREIKKEYSAFVKGNVKKEKGTIDSAVGRHHTQRKKMDTGHGRPACTHFEVLQRGINWTHLKLRPETGRTHQIRVHLASIHHPVLGDKLYGGKTLNLGKLKMERQALHARQLELTHPISGKSFSFSAQLPFDMESFLLSQK